MDGSSLQVPTRRRKRRTREDVAGRIRDAARELFAERGYAATTTKEIARRADVSETLLFRYYGGKAALYDEVVSTPFNVLMREFLASSARVPPGARAQDARRFTAKVHGLFESNRQLFAALLAAPRQASEDVGAPPLHGLDAYFEASVTELRRLYAARGETPAFDLAVGVRLGFGMIAASVLLGEWLFSGESPGAAAKADVLMHMVERALSPSRPAD